MSLVKRGPTPEEPGPSPAPFAEAPFEGWLVRAVRMPVRIVTLVLIVPVRLLWDALTACGRALRRVLWVPFARASQWVWRRVLAPVLHALLVWPWLALWTYVLAPAGRGLLWLARTAGAGTARAGRGLWAGLTWLGRHLVVAPLSLLYRHVLAPLGRGALALAAAVGAGLAWLGRAVGVGLVWLGRTVIGVPLGFLHRWVLKPVGLAVLAVMAAAGAGLAWLWRYLVVAPRGLLHRYVLSPVWRGVLAGVRGAGAGLAWLWRYLVVVPCGFVLRRLLRPTGRAVAVVAREIADAVAHAWRVAGYVSRTVFRAVGRVLRFLFVDPVVWLWRHVVRPVGRGLRDAVWRPAVQAVREAGRGVRAALASARASVRQTRAELRRALFGGPPVGKPGSEPVPEPASGPAPHRRALPERGRVPWDAGSPHNSATQPDAFGAKRDDADFRTL
ncbi:hypothetical protein [Streptomyces sp. WMMB 322]|uniref:hypothetical protein n=1 Tax=Streptomyces sp. WMMB 322 TaxID=1286821 RepID=UPI001585EF99|nr:hypothetical protein [Streptomyces sp. WMMB 322]